MSSFDKYLLGDSPEFRETVNAARVVAPTDVTVLILGESGTGKEVLAKALHAESPRRDQPFVAVNCASLPESLAESLLFGHRKGSFTGAVNDHNGYIRAANGGTLFLDEVGELPANVQAKLLRFLESSECLPVGEVTPVRTDVRIIAATHRDLQEEVREGRFREDLYYRLYVVPLTIPPLRERRSDITPLARHLIAEQARSHNLPAPQFARSALTVMKEYPWPGNIRELRNLCERLVVLLPGRTIEAENLPPEMRNGPAAKITNRDIQLPNDGVVLDELEASLIRQALDRTGGNRSRAARLLGLTRDTLLYRLKKYAIS